VKFLEFNSKSFFFFLLPPIILESAYSLNDSAFTNNLGTIVIYAVVGTILNIAIVGGLLIFLDTYELFGMGMSPLDCLLFASLIAAVDPVAVSLNLGLYKSMFRSWLSSRKSESIRFSISWSSENPYSTTQSRLCAII
jgi:NhaP-type Na+/H+ or K+/H+ antiporter